MSSMSNINTNDKRTHMSCCIVTHINETNTTDTSVASESSATTTPPIRNENTQIICDEINVNNLSENKNTLSFNNIRNLSSKQLSNCVCCIRKLAHTDTIQKGCTSSQ